MSDAPDWQHVINTELSAMSDAPDWQTVAVEPGGGPIGGAPRFKGTLYVRATGKPLPVRFVESNAKNSVSVTWSNWGHHYVLTMPTSAVAWPTT